MGFMIRALRLIGFARTLRTLEVIRTELLFSGRVQERHRLELCLHHHKRETRSAERL
jgi:hypothetical protein